MDWSRTALGAREGWSPRLSTLAETILTNRIPMVVLWGRDLLHIYNDAYAELIGRKHPAAMGRGNKELWPEVWHINGPIYDAVFGDGREFYFEDALYPLERKGLPEEVYLTISYGPVRDEDGSVGGVLVTMLETTRKVVDERRLKSLRELALHSSRARSVEAVGAAASEALAKNNADIPFALIYANRARRSEDRPRPAMIGNAGLAGDDDHLAQRAFEAPRDGRGLVIALPDEGGPYPGGLLHARAQHAYVASLAGPGRAEALGALVLGMSPAQAGDARYVEYLETVASQLSAAFENATVFSREHRIADTLQRAALPGDLAHLRGLSVDAMYQAGRDEASIGGDWYDAFELEDGRVMISIGDVAGSGVAAAAAMGGARQMIRALAHVQSDPRAVLDAIDSAFRREHPNLFVTAFVGVIDAARTQLTYASAGHPTPLLRHPDGRLEDLYAPELPIGLRGGDSVNSTTVALPAGGVLVLYTDGLTEATHDTEAGEARLRSAVASPEFARSPHPGAFVYDHVLGGPATDDVAILTVALT